MNYEYLLASNNLLYLYKNLKIKFKIVYLFIVFFVVSKNSKSALETLRRPQKLGKLPIHKLKIV